MAPVQAQIEFPVRKSSRRKTTKTADITDSNQTSTRSTRSNKKPVLSSVDNVLLVEEKSSRSSRKKSPVKSKSKNAAIRTRETTPTKALIPNDKKLTPSKRRAKNDIAESVSPTKLRANDNLPLSPSKLFDSNILVQGCNGKQILFQKFVISGYHTEVQPCGAYFIQIHRGIPKK